jgi:carnosine N-methyltransferase
MSQWWPEVMRVLRPGGVFIHFGPLQYHFNSLHDNYSATDLRAYIQAKQFEICDEQWTLSQHLGRAFQRFAPLYDNWSFAAIKHGLQPNGSNVG